MITATLPPSCCGMPSLIDATGFCLGCEARPRCVRLAYPVLKQIAVKARLSDELFAFEAAHAELLSASKPGKVSPRAPAQVNAMPTQSNQVSEVAMMLTEAQRDTIDSLPVKIQAKVRVLMQKGVDRAAPGRIARGDNPFPESASMYLRMTGAVLTKFDSISKADLRSMFLRNLKWTDATAASHVSAAVAILTALGIARVDSDRLHLLRTERGNIAA